jgi:hypothetical protein
MEVMNFDPNLGKIFKKVGAGLSLKLLFELCSPKCLWVIIFNYVDRKVAIVKQREHNLTALVAKMNELPAGC